jgi:bifunctional DNA-binding transcriptional regulator/antitoxin component of YhaV-PrlF toxin-antitoxin module
MGHGLANKPHSGATLRVWEVADEITREKRRLARRREVIDRVLAEGGNANTASTQYYNWKSAQEEAAGRAAAATPAQAGPVSLSMGADGRIVVPADIRRAMGLADGGTVSARLVDGELRLVSPLAALRAAQAIAEKYRPAGSVVDDFLAERKALWGEE